MTEVPQRGSLVAQVVEILRRDLQRGEWSEHLPTEAFLCDRLQVGRKTLRAALAVLGREGLIVSSQGRRRRITKRARRQRPVKSNVVAWMSPDPLHTLSAFMLLYVSELRRHLQEAGYALQIVPSPPFSQHPQPTLENLARQTHAACWLLVHSPENVQRWFWERKIPCLLSGAAHKGIDLPSIATNHRTVCRHAAGVFLRHGHRRIALVAPRSDLAGNLASEQGFREGYPTGGAPAGFPLVLHHDSTVEGIRSVLSSLFASQARPTGLLVSYPQHVLTVISHMLSAGTRIPVDASVISRDYDFFLENLHPSVARYEFDHQVYAARLARLVVQLATTGFLPPRTTWMMPEFKTGGTLAPLPR